MQHRVFVYGTLLAGEVNHRLLAGARLLGEWLTPPCYTLYDLGAYPGIARGGCTAVVGEVFAIDAGALARLDRLEEYPRLYRREPILTTYGRAWIYLYRGRLADRPTIAGGDWRAFASDPDSYRAAGVRGTRDPKNRRPPGAAVAPPRAPSTSGGRCA
jgi:gamma-glutamylaminecyclotransferase